MRHETAGDVPRLGLGGMGATRDRSWMGWDQKEGGGYNARCVHPSNGATAWRDSTYLRDKGTWNEESGESWDEEGLGGERDEWVRISKGVSAKKFVT